MITILEKRMPIYSVECGVCKSSLEFDECDIQYDGKEYCGRDLLYSFIICPVCKKYILSKIDGLETSLIERIKQLRLTFYM